MIETERLDAVEISAGERDQCLRTGRAAEREDAVEPDQRQLGAQRRREPQRLGGGEKAENGVDRANHGIPRAVQPETFLIYRFSRWDVNRHRQDVDHAAWRETIIETRRNQNTPRGAYSGQRRSDVLEVSAVGLSEFSLGLGTEEHHLDL
jgi:hypothetical protein